MRLDDISEETFFHPPVLVFTPGELLPPSPTLQALEPVQEKLEHLLELEERPLQLGKTFFEIPPEPK